MTDVLKTYPSLTREEFDRLLDAYMDAYGGAVFAQRKTAAEYRDATIKAVEARIALCKAVFP